MEKRKRVTHKPSPQLLAKIAERLSRKHEIPTYKGMIVMYDKEKHVLWSVEAKYGYDYWTVSDQRNLNKRVSSQQYMNEVFYECPEVDSIECINAVLHTYNLYVWDHKINGTLLKETGEIVFGKRPKLTRVDGPGPNETSEDTTVAL